MKNYVRQRSGEPKRSTTREEKTCSRLRLFELVLQAPESIDSALLSTSPVRWWAWQTVF